MVTIAKEGLEDKYGLKLNPGERPEGSGNGLDGTPGEVSPVCQRFPPPASQVGLRRGGVRSLLGGALGVVVVSRCVPQEGWG